MAVAAAVLGIAAAFFFPAYSAYLPRILPAEQLLAANGVEGVVRPVLQRAAGPAVAGARQGHLPDVGRRRRRGVVRSRAGAVGSHPARHRSARDRTTGRPHLLDDLRAGLRFVVGTPWLLATVLFATGAVLLIIGPIEVLLPFVTAEPSPTARGCTASR